MNNTNPSLEALLNELQYLPYGFRKFVFNYLYIIEQLNQNNKLLFKKNDDLLNSISPLKEEIYVLKNKTINTNSTGFNDRKKEILEKFIEWLTSFDDEFDLEQSANPIDDQIDLYSLYSELTALKNEIKIESRYIKKTIDTFSAINELIESKNIKISRNISKENNDVAALVSDIIEIKDRVEIGASILQKFNHFNGDLEFKGNVNTIRNFSEAQQMLLKRIDEILDKYNVIHIEALNKKFDPEFMKVVETDSDNQKSDSIVLEEIRKGYMLNDNVFRPVEVKVNKTWS